MKLGAGSFKFLLRNYTCWDGLKPCASFRASESSQSLHLFPAWFNGLLVLQACEEIHQLVGLASFLFLLMALK